MIAANTVLDECESTNDLARKLGESGAPHGTWISARRQTAGRGRLGRQWTSSEGNLFLSLIVRFEDKSKWTWVPLAAAVGVAQAFAKLNVRIKWPNDLWVDGKKLGGILCEGVGTSQGSFIIIGLGMNCAHAPEGLDQLTTSLSLAAAQSITADDIRENTIHAVLDAVELLLREGPAALSTRYAKFAALGPGTAIQWNQETGTVVGLGPSGELRVKSLNGEERSIFAEDVKVRALSSPRPT